MKNIWNVIGRLTNHDCEISSTSDQILPAGGVWAGFHTGWTQCRHKPYPAFARRDNVGAYEARDEHEAAGVHSRYCDARKRGRERSRSWAPYRGAHYGGARDHSGTKQHVRDDSKGEGVDSRRKSQD